MIVYTLLLSYQDKDTVSIMLTSLVIYIIIYNLLTIKYNYIILAIVSVVDIYMSKDIFRQTTKTTKAYRSKLGKHDKTDKHDKHVTFADTPQYYSPNQHAQQSQHSQQTYDTNTPAYRLWQVEQQQQAQQQQQLQLHHHQLLQTQEQMQNVQQNQIMQQYDTDSNGSTNTNTSIVSSELTYSSEDLS